MGQLESGRAVQVHDEWIGRGGHCNMPSEKPQDKSIKECLGCLGISSIYEWDVLFFLHRHGAIITRRGELARLVGYDYKAVSDALDKLQDRGLVASSPSNARTELYQTSVDGQGQYKTSFQQLIRVAASREGRLILARQLRVAAGSPVKRGDYSGQE
jgi:DNA-binding MarR family transcriptional regulator